MSDLRSFLNNSSCVALLESKSTLDQFGSECFFFGARLAVSDSAGKTLHEVLLMSNLDSAGLVQMLTARLLRSSIEHQLLQD